WARRKAQRVRILGVVYILISLGGKRCENEFLAGQQKLGNVAHRPAGPHTREVGMLCLRLRIALVPPRPDCRLRLAGLRATTLSRRRRGRDNRDGQYQQSSEHRAEQTPSHTESLPKSLSDYCPDDSSTQILSVVSVPGALTYLTNSAADTGRF